jgi:formamidopyrimidine-DNA glycosylase
VPELPEVETMRRLVERHLAGKTVSGQVLTLEKLLRESPLPSLDPIVGRAVLAARRRAKVLVVDLSGDLSLMLHFKLAGQLAIMLPNGERAIAGHPVPKPDGPYPHKATHWTVTFDDGTIAYYSDIRQFGWIRLLPSEDVSGALTGFSFGPEAIGPEGIHVADLTSRLLRRSIPIKQALLDQRVLAGLGNIYVDEALHAAKIHPARPAKSLTADEIARLHPAISWALEQGIDQGGAKIIHSRAYPIDGFPAIHAREGETCATCGSTVVKTRVGGRGTYYCPACQPAPDQPAPNPGDRAVTGG